MISYLKNVDAYQLAVHQAKQMLKVGTIDENDYIKIEEKMAEKYCINKHSIYRLDNLISTPTRGNMSTELEG